MDNDCYAEIEESVRSLIENVKTRLSEEDIARVRAAYEFAAEAHKDQRRKGGQPYIVHPIAVARIVAEQLELGANPIIAAFLHDVVEDTPYTIKDVEDRFGADVAFLVDVVTKKEKKNYKHSKQVDNFRQILESVQYDVRALLIKLADRLHNMRTLASMRPDKQMKIAGETDYFYAPLANRLGMYHIKTELENLSFRYRCPREYAAIEKQIKDYEASSKADVEAFVSKIDTVLKRHRLDVRTEVRYRMPYNIWRKMHSVGCDFHHVEGKRYLRIIFSTKNIADEKMKSLHIYAIITNYFKERPGSVANYINAPKENGYQSFHVKLLSEQGTWEEIHISSERMVRNSRLGCAAERTEENVKGWLARFTSVLKDIANHADDMDYMDGVTSSFYNDDILVFTPEGRGIILPKDATALDFAYEVHSDIGRHAVYARVNGVLCSVKTVLHRGDCVEIGTDEASKPDADWINHVLTYKAKRNLRTFLTNSPKIEYLRCTSCHPMPGDEVVGFRNDDGRLMLHKRNCPTAIRLASQSGDSIVAVTFKEESAFLYPVRVCIRAVDRYHLLRDVVACVTEKQHLSISKLVTVTTDRIVETQIDFEVHSVNELQEAMKSISNIPSIDEVYRMDVE